MGIQFSVRTSEYRPGVEHRVCGNEMRKLGWAVNAMVEFGDFLRWQVIKGF